MSTPHPEVSCGIGPSSDTECLADDLIVFSRLCKKPPHDYRKAFEYSFFGAYTLDSEAYKISRIHAAYPPIYIRRLVQFFYERDPGPNLFYIGEPITVTVESLQQHQILGHALYGLVRSIDEQQKMSKWPKVSVRMVVEVHCIPGIDVEWQYALPWITSPPNIVFTQPHGFLEDSYVPVAIEDVDWIEVNYGDGEDYGGNIASVYLDNYDYEDALRCYTAKVVNKPRMERLLPDDAYLHWDDTEFVVSANANIIMNDSAASIVDNTEHIANDAQSVTDNVADNTQDVVDDTRSPADTLVEPDHSLLLSTTTSPLPSDDEDVDVFAEIKVGLAFHHIIGPAQAEH